MGLTIAIGLVFFAGMMAILFFGHQQAEKDREERAAAEAARGHSQLDDRAEGRTADEVVFDIEHRIASDLQEVATVLHPTAPDRATRPHQAQA